MASPQQLDIGDKARCTIDLLCVARSTIRKNGFHISHMKAFSLVSRLKKRPRWLFNHSALTRETTKLRSRRQPKHVTVSEAWKRSTRNNTNKPKPLDCFDVILVLSSGLNTPIIDKGIVPLAWLQVLRENSRRLLVRSAMRQIDIRALWQVI